MKMSLRFWPPLHILFIFLQQAFHYDRDDIALPGTHRYFLKASDRHRESAKKLMGYQNKRGGRIVLQGVLVSIYWDGIILGMTYHEAHTILSESI